MYNLYSYMFRHFHVIISEYYICASLSYTSFTKWQLLKIQFHKIKMFHIKSYKFNFKFLRTYMT
jgi:hypothetical protein